MKKPIFLCTFLILLGASYQLECSNYYDETCGNHNIDYKLKCKLFSSQCHEIEQDDGCIVASENSCTKESSVPDNEACVFFVPYKCKRVKISGNCEISGSNCGEKNTITQGKKCSYDLNKKNCQEYDKTCTDYSDSTCGNIAIKDKIQCALLRNNQPCQEIEIDDYCHIDTNGDCKKQENKSFNETLYKCYLYDNKCKRVEIKCEEKDNSKCQEISNCYSIIDNHSSQYCKEVIVDQSCKIENGKCVNKTTLNQNMQCSFIDYFDECKLIKKNCSECSSSCEDCTVTDGYECKEISENKCKEILIHKSCKVENKECKIKQETEGKACQFNSDKSICLLVDYSKCKYESSCSDNSPPTGTKCFPSETGDECGYRNLECSDLDQSSCKDISETKKCFWYGYNLQSSCVEYTTDKFCSIDNNGECKQIESEKENFAAGEGCFLDLIEDSTPLKYSCKKRVGKCSEFKDSSCGGITNCKFNGSYCVLNEGNCSIGNLNDDCAKKDNTILPSGKKCDFGYNSKNEYACMAVDKTCGDYNQNDCKNVARTDSYQCYYDSTCKNVTLEGGCYINNEGKCINSGTISTNEICVFDNLKTKCYKREKTCSDLVGNDCQAFTPETKLCFNFGEESSYQCKEVKVDSSCQINEENNCVAKGSLDKGKSCVFDEQKDSCYVKDESNYLSLKLFSILALFFVF